MADSKEIMVIRAIGKDFSPDLKELMGALQHAGLDVKQEAQHHKLAPDSVGRYYPMALYEGRVVHGEASVFSTLSKVLHALKKEAQIQPVEVRDAKMLEALKLMAPAMRLLDKARDILDEVKYPDHKDSYDFYHNVVLMLGHATGSLHSAGTSLTGWQQRGRTWQDWGDRVAKRPPKAPVIGYQDMVFPPSHETLRKAKDQLAAGEITSEDAVVMLRGS